MPNIQMFQPTRILSSAAKADLLDGISHSLAVGTTNILVNLQNVLFIDSIGLAALAIARKQVRTANGRFGLCCLNGQARMVIEQSGMGEQFDVYDTPTEFRRTLADTQS